MKLTQSFLIRFSVLPVLLCAAACSTTSNRPDEPAESAYQKICGPSDEVDQVIGSVWVKIDSPRGKAQFPATVLYERVPAAKLILQVTDLIGTPVSQLTVDSRGLRVEGQGANIDWIKKSVETQSLLGLKPATLLNLFSGKTLCPASTSRLYWSENELVAEVNRTLAYRYGLTQWGDRTLVASIAVAGLKVEFMDPEDPIGLPKQMHGESAQGSIKVRWKDRKLQLKPKTPN